MHQYGFLRTLISIATLFVVDFKKEKRKQPECPPIEKELIVLEYYAIIKGNELDLYVRTCRCVHNVLSEKEKLQSNISSLKSEQTILHHPYVFICICVSTENEVERQTLNL